MSVGIEGLYEEISLKIKRECELTNKTLVISIYGLVEYFDNKKINNEFRGDLGSLYVNINLFLNQLNINYNKIYLMDDFNYYNK